MSDEFKKETDDIPEFIYHYTTGEKLKKILYAMKFKFSSLKDTNDPKEYKDSFHSIGIGPYPDPSNDKIKHDLILSKIDLPNNIQIQMAKFRDCNIKIACFCRDKDENKMPEYEDKAFKNGYAKARMWAQYGEEHKGYCLKFSGRKFISKILEKENEYLQKFNNSIRYGLNYIEEKEKHIFT